MRLVSYLRVSSETQLDGYGLDVQRKAVKAWAKAHGHRIVAEYADEGASGTLPAEDRPGLSAALAALRKPPQADGLIVAKLDRFARSLAVQEATLAVVWRIGATMYTADGGEVLQDDPDDPMRTAMRQMVGVFAELDRRTVVKRLRDGRAAKKAAGRHSTGAYAYGYTGQGEGRDRDAAPRADEQAAVRRILDLRKQGASYRAIAATLDAEDLKPRRAPRWSPMAVRNIWERETTRHRPATHGVRPPSPAPR